MVVDLPKIRLQNVIRKLESEIARLNKYGIMDMAELQNRRCNKIGYMQGVILSSSAGIHSCVNHLKSELDG